MKSSSPLTAIMFRAPVQRHAVQASLYTLTSEELTPNPPVPSADFLRSTFRLLIHPQQNLTKLLQKVAKEKGYTDTLFFVDNHITGTTMTRPGFLKMMAAIEARRVSAVFVKDLSRLGRNYTKVYKLTVRRARRPA